MEHGPEWGKRMSIRASHAVCVSVWVGGCVGFVGMCGGGVCVHGRGGGAVHPLTPHGSEHQDHIELSSQQQLFLSKG